MSISVTNTDAGLSGKTIVNAEDTQTVTGAKTFDRDPSAPFVVTSGSAEVANLIAERATYAINAYQGQLVFPAAQNASTDANTLDDYEEGTFTPTIVSSGGGAGATYGAARAGSYIKIGQLVWISGRVVLTSKAGLAAGTLTLGALPFTAAATPAAMGGVSISSFANTTTSMSSLYCYVIGGTASAQLQYMTAAGTTTLANVADTDISNTLDITYGGCYRASA